MCSPARCSSCGKITWTGCGMHVGSVMANVQAAQRSDCADRMASPPVSPDRRFTW